MSEKNYERVLARAVIEQGLKDTSKGEPNTPHPASEYFGSEAFRKHLGIADYSPPFSTRVEGLFGESAIRRKYQAKELLGLLKGE